MHSRDTTSLPASPRVAVHRSLPMSEAVTVILKVSHNLMASTLPLLLAVEDGKRTLETCRRAKTVFNVEAAILVTQDYHQPRALYLCNVVGIDSIGIKANRRTYDGESYYQFREFFSTAAAWFEVNFW